MDQERSRIAADLGGLIEGEVDCDPLRLQLYSSDASIHEIRPLGVVRPRSTRDVAQVVRYASENQITLHPRGCGSNVIGSAVGGGLVVDFSCHMRRVVAVDDHQVRVQPGVVLANLNRLLLERGRFLASDPATRSVSTVGGMLGLNLTGSHWKRHGTPRDRVLALEVVLATGETVSLHAAGSTGSMPLEGDDVAISRWSTIRNRLGDLLAGNRALIQSQRPATATNQSGYNLFDLGPGPQPDLVRLLAGSQGTLGLITEATLATDPLPLHRGAVLLFFDSFDAAARVGVEIAAGDIDACDLLDRRLLRLAREMHAGSSALIPDQAEAMLLVGLQAPSDGMLRGQMEQLVTRATRRRQGAFASRSTTQTAERNQYWRLARRVIPTLYQLQGSRRAVPFLEDLAVAPARLPALFQGIHKLLNEHEVTAATFAHVPQGVVQVYPFLDPGSGEDQRLMARLAVAVADLVIGMRGTISGAFGDGLSRTWLSRRQFGPLQPLLVEIKNLFDPQHLLNPGIVVDQPPHELTSQMRSTALAVASPAAANSPAESTALPVLRPELAWEPGDMLLAARNCNGCARCRTTSPEQRMCPVYRVLPREEASPRAKANLMRGVLTGQLPAEAVAQDDFRAIADLCFNCHQCRLECPASVDIPRLMVEAKAQHVAVNGLRLNDWLLSRLDLLYWLGGLAPRVTNYLMVNRLSRWVLDRFVGIAQGRKLPRFSQRNFISWAIRERLHQARGQGSPKVVFFVDAFVNWNDLELGQALVKVLQHNGVSVVVPQQQTVSGMSLISDGVLARARQLATKNVELLAEYVRNGYDIVTTEPSAALALRREYVHLLDDPDAALVAGKVQDACQYLWNLHQTGRLELDFRPLNTNIGYHTPCHLRALEVGTPGVNLLRLIPGLGVTTIEQGCSGMAGTFGLKRKNWVRSIRIGRGLINAVRDQEIVSGSTECTTCRIQMEQFSSKPTVHPVKILALAYGLMPQLEGMFARRSGELQLS